MIDCANFPWESVSTTSRFSEEARLHLVSCNRCYQRLQVLLALEKIRKGPERVSLRGTRIELIAAGALLVVALAGIVRFNPSVVEQPSALATSQPYSLFPLQVRAGQDPDENLRSQALRAYQAGDFQVASDLFAQLPAGPEVSFFRGVCLYLLNRPRPALEMFVQASDSPIWQPPADWFRANALLRLGEVEEARSILEGLSAGVSDYRSRARQLLSRLRNLP